MAKKIIGSLKLQVKAGQANPSPPVGPALGQRGLNIMAFVKEFNTYKEELKKPYRAGTDDLDRLTKEAYDRLTQEVKVAHLLIVVKPGASCGPLPWPARRPTRSRLS